MHDYMRVLHARFCQAPELRDLREEQERPNRTLKAALVQQDQGLLLQLADLENKLREEPSPTCFIAGSQLGWGSPGKSSLTTSRMKKKSGPQKGRKRSVSTSKIDTLYTGKGLPAAEKRIKSWTK